MIQTKASFNNAEIKDFFKKSSPTRANEVKDLFDRLVSETGSTVHSSSFSIGTTFNGVFITPEGVPFRLYDNPRPFADPRVGLMVEGFLNHIDSTNMFDCDEIFTSATGDKQFKILLDATKVLNEKAVIIKEKNDKIAEVRAKNSQKELLSTDILISLGFTESALGFKTPLLKNIIATSTKNGSFNIEFKTGDLSLPENKEKLIKLMAFLSDEQ